MQKKMDNTVIFSSTTSIPTETQNDLQEATTSISSSSAACPDSSVQPYLAPFTEGEEILVQDSSDSRLYFGVVVEVDDDQGQCLVRFGDCTERWAQFFELKRLGDPVPDTEADQEPVVLSDPIRSQETQERIGQPVSELEALHHQFSAEACTWEREQEYDKVPKTIVIPSHVLEARAQLPYSWDSLTWDSAHLKNSQEVYCYCGEKGDWFRRMLQCCDCLQWFHQQCITSLDHHLSGDRFYKFTCTLCNGSQEASIIRMDIALVDALHLVIFNLILTKNQKFHDLEASILPFLKKKVKNLANNSTKSNKIESEIVTKILSSHKRRFMCGIEKGKAGNFWGLRKMVAPPIKYFNNYRPRYVTNPPDLKTVNEAVIQPYNKSASKRRQGQSLSRNPAKRGRVKQLSSTFYADHSDISEASSFGTLDTLIKMPKDFSGRNNPFCVPGPPSDTKSDLVPSSGEVTPTQSSSTSSLKTFLSEKLESPLGSEVLDEIRSEPPPTPGIIKVLDDILSTSFEESRGISHFTTSARLRISKGEKFFVKARRLLLNGDIAYLLDWEDSSAPPLHSSIFSIPIDEAKIYEYSEEAE